jgi:hypothetical protein
VNNKSIGRSLQNGKGFQSPCMLFFPLDDIFVGLEGELHLGLLDIHILVVKIYFLFQVPLSTNDFWSFTICCASMIIFLMQVYYKTWHQIMFNLKIHGIHSSKLNHV